MGEKNGSETGNAGRNKGTGHEETNKESSKKACVQCLFSCPTWLVENEEI